MSSGIFFFVDLGGCGTNPASVFQRPKGFLCMSLFLTCLGVLGNRGRLECCSSADNDVESVSTIPASSVSLSSLGRSGKGSSC